MESYHNFKKDSPSLIVFGLPNKNDLSMI